MPVIQVSEERSPIRFKWISREKSFNGFEHWIWQSKNKKDYALIIETSIKSYYINCRLGDRVEAKELKVADVRLAKKYARRMLAVKLDMSKL